MFFIEAPTKITYFLQVFLIAPPCFFQVVLIRDFEKYCKTILGKKWPEKYVVRNGWQTFQRSQPTQEISDYVGGCVDYKESVGVKVQITHAPRAYVECLRQCQDAGEDCLSVTYFPRLLAPYWKNFWSGEGNKKKTKFLRII